MGSSGWDNVGKVSFWTILLSGVVKALYNLFKK